MNRQILIETIGELRFLRGVTEKHLDELAGIAILEEYEEGDVLFAEDLKGEGHSNRELHGPRMSLIIQVTEDFDIRRFTKPR